ncbi:DUF1552 domain-containing protein [Tamlana sp. 2201CG12-4]|uniref:DUF1552 domain-containing protein n=1 Tax=Tamlana sp. 2201CG12-4 TaxID=3112582 RepID=UPI002DB63F7D|nr:DUF1552 domain-containing protein [Tamlana sp. 2201CG12-4]MEC3907888.1 DUF1552 domain-containing protein [Tamlana sp. 2201CG12-4]
MAKKSWHLDRRTFIKGLGVACMIPYMESMGMNSLSSFAEKRDIPKRLCYLYFPNGVAMPPKESPEHSKWNWFPLKDGTDYELTQSLSSLAPFRKDMSILGGLSHPFSRSVLGHIAGDTWLTAGDLRGEYKNSISVDQVAAKYTAEKTRFPSLSLSTDGGVGYKSRASTLSFDSVGRAIPSEHRQREIFERYFSPNGGASSMQRRKSLNQGKKIVDLVLEDSKNLQRKLGKNDKVKMDEYLASLNRVEEQVKRNEKWLDIPLKDFDASLLNLDVSPSDPEAYLRSTLDLMILGFETDATRVITYMMAREDGMGFGDSFPKIALGTKGHHSISHDKTKGHWVEWGEYDQWLAKQFAYFLDRMKNTSDEHGSLLDNTIILYGSACSSTHNANNCPLVLAGGSKLGLKHGSYTKFDAKHVHLSNLFVSMLNAIGIPTETFADSTGPLPAIFS